MGTGVSPKRITTGILFLFLRFFPLPDLLALRLLALRFLPLRFFPLENSTVYKTLTSSSVLVGLIQLLLQPSFYPASLERR